MRQLILFGVLLVVIVGSGVAFYVMSQEQPDPDSTAPSKEGEELPAPPAAGEAKAATEKGPAPLPAPPPTGGNPAPKQVVHPPLLIDKGMYHPRLGLLPEDSVAAAPLTPPAMDSVRLQREAEERDRKIKEELAKQKEARKKEKADIVKAVEGLDEEQGDKLLNILKEAHQVAYMRFRELRTKGSPTTQKEVLANVRWEYYQKLDKFLSPLQVEAFCQWWDDLSGLEADPSKR